MLVKEIDENFYFDILQFNLQKNISYIHRCEQDRKKKLSDSVKNFSFVVFILYKFITEFSVLKYFSFFYFTFLILCYVEKVFLLYSIEFEKKERERNIKAYADVGLITFFADKNL